MKTETTVSRRDLLRAGGALIVSFGWNSPKPGVAQPPQPAALDLDSFLAIHDDGSVTIATSKVDPGTGLTAVYRQIAAEELGVPVERLTVVQGDTAATPNHGGTGGSTGVPRGGADIRRAAATARMALVEMASKRLNVPAKELSIVGGEVRPARGNGVSIAALMSGRKFNLKLDPNAPLKDPASYTVVGKPVPRMELPGKATGRHVYVHDHSIPGMLHGRVIRPPAVGARLLSVDEGSVRSLPNIRVVRIENFLGVVAPDEWAAVRAAQTLKASWSQTRPDYETAQLERGMSAAPVEREQIALNRGDSAAALRTAGKVVSAAYYWPFHSHASLAPSCAIADVRKDGATIWSSTQDCYGLRNLVARTFDMQADKVRVVYLEGSGSYGSNGAFDAAADAVLLSRAVEAPVRLQWMRHDEHGWDPKGPAQLLELRGALNADGAIAAWESRTTGPAGPAWTDTLLGPVAAGLKPGASRGSGAPVVHNLDPPYAIPNLSVASRLLKDTPIRTSNLRAPGKIGTVFAVESFMDELAAEARVDPVEFRRRALSDPRALAVLNHAAEMIGWKPRVSPSPGSRSGATATGRGIAYMRYKQAENYVAMAMDVEVDRQSGRITVRKIACAHDCGLIMNPDGLRNQVEGNILQTLSRSLHEEVTFRDGHVTSVDWATYPILRFPEAPQMEVALINHPDQPAYGAGEAACAPVAAALANAVFDATGVRLRSVPFTSAKVKAALA